MGQLICTTLHGHTFHDFLTSNTTMPTDEQQYVQLLYSITHSLISTSQRTCLDTARSPNLTINHLPDEVLLVIFDSYRQGIDSYDHQWRTKYAWFNLTHVCRNWRAVIFASSSRLDLGIAVGPTKPDDIEPILSGPLPILVEYKEMYKDITSSALWRMRAALEQRDRVRRISFEGTRASMDQLFGATNCTFPALDSVVLRSSRGQDLAVPGTFLREAAADVSDLHLRRLSLGRVSLTSISGFLLSTSAVTDLSLQIDTAFGTSSETSLLACLQGTHCLCRLDLSIYSAPLDSPPPPLSPQDVVQLSKLTCFHYAGHPVFLEALVAGLSAPYLREIRLEFRVILSPIVHLTRFINETEEHFHVVHVNFHEHVFDLSLQTQSVYTCICDTRIQSGYTRFCGTCTPSSQIPKQSPESVTRLCGALSKKLSAVEELRVVFGFAMMAADDYMLWRRFYEQFPGVKVFKAYLEEETYDFLAPTFLRNRETAGAALAFFPALEEIQLGKGMFWTPGSHSKTKLAVFRPFVSARKRAGYPVRVSFCP